MSKWISIKLVNFGLWIYEINMDMNWDDEDLQNYKKLKEIKAKLLDLK